MTAIPELLRALNLKDCIVSIDAMGTQTEIVNTICEKQADDLLPVKRNQPSLHLRKQIRASMNDDHLKQVLVQH